MDSQKGVMKVQYRGKSNQAREGHQHEGGKVGATVKYSGQKTSPSADPVKLQKKGRKQGSGYNRPGEEKKKETDMRPEY